ncbi:hypothetical protein B0T17DRAFT_456817, partial [Bombardia bombarda]
SSSRAMFQSIISGQAARTPTPTAPTSNITIDQIDLLKDMATIQETLDQEGPTAAAAFAFFERAVYPRIAQSGPDLPLLVKSQITALMSKLSLEGKQDAGNADPPIMTRITEIMLALDIFNPKVWGTLVLQLVEQICQVNMPPEGYSSTESYGSAMAQRDAHLDDLKGAWSIFCCHGPVQINEDDAVAETDGIADDASEKPTLHPRRPPVSAELPAFSQKFTEAFSHYPGPLLTPAWAAYVSYAVLITHIDGTSAVVRDNSSFVSIMSRILYNSKIPHLKKALGPALSDYPHTLAYIRPHFTKAALAAASQKAVEQELANIHRQLGQAIKARNLRAVQEAWKLFWGKSDVPDAARIKVLHTNPLLFNYFIMAYMALRVPALAIEVWNSMTRINIMPTIKTWNSMIKGCANARNENGINTVWNRLIASGIQLDTAIWTARIHGLILSGSLSKGLQALDEMARTWRERARPENQAIAVQPTIEPVNAALAGLLRFERLGAAKGVLRWATEQGITPDIYTFNTLLRPLVRKGKMAEVKEMFEMMRKANVSVDSATFTILLDEALTSLEHQTPEQMVHIVTKAIADMDAVGIRANMLTYGKIIYLLLQVGDEADQPVRAVLAHMWHKGIELSSHIYTMLAEFYFSRDPPEAGVVTALIESRHLHSNKDIDRVFWERVMKGYCQVGEVDRAQAIFNRLFAEGTTITFSTLYELLLALVNAGLRDDAAAIVVKARSIKEADEEVGRERIRFWKHRFWHLAYREGLLAEDLYEPFRQA